MEDKAAEKERARDLKIKTIGNYVHDSVPVSDNEVVMVNHRILGPSLTHVSGRQWAHQEMGSSRCHSREEKLLITS